MPVCTDYIAGATGIFVLFLPTQYEDIMPEVTINNCKIHYTENGIEHGSPVIFIHGFPFSGEMWEEQVQLLADTHRIITYDIRGHGKSSSGDGDFLIDFFVDDLFGLMDQLEIRAANIIGLSMGGYIALRGIEREPDRYLSLVLCDTKSEADPNEGKLKRADAVRTIRSKGVEAFCETFLKAIFAEESFVRRPEAVRKIEKTILSTPADTLCRTQIALAARTDTTEILHTISIPTLILVGSQDQLTPPAAAQAMANRIRDSRIKILEGAAHMSNLESPEEFNAQLREFFE
jgi:3-oxoadipate enol-lactonase